MRSVLRKPSAVSHSIVTRYRQFPSKDKLLFSFPSQLRRPVAFGASGSQRRQFILFEAL